VGVGLLALALRSDTESEPTPALRATPLAEGIFQIESGRLAGARGYANKYAGGVGGTPESGGST